MYNERKRIPGDIVTVLDTVGEYKGWWKGKVTRNSTEQVKNPLCPILSIAKPFQVGFFPISYVESMRPNLVESYTLNANGVREPQQLLLPESKEAEESTL